MAVPVLAVPHHLPGHTNCTCLNRNYSSLNNIQYRWIMKCNPFSDKLQNTLLSSHLRSQRGTARGSSSHCGVSNVSMPSPPHCQEMSCLLYQDVRCPHFTRWSDALTANANNSVHSWSAPGSDWDTRPISARPRPRCEDTTGPRAPFPVCRQLLGPAYHTGSHGGGVLRKNYQ